MKKKVVHICYSGIGGQPNAAINFANFGNSNDAEYMHHIIFCGIESLHIDNQNKCKTNGTPYSYILKKEGLDIIFFFRLFNLIISLKPVLLISHTNSYHIIAFITKVVLGNKVISVEHHSILLRNKLNLLHSKISGIISNRIVVLNDEAKSFFVSKGVIKANKIVVIPNGIIQYSKNKNIRSQQKNNVHIGVVSRLTDGKDIITVLKAIQLLAIDEYPVSLSIVGTGKDYDSLVEFTSELEIINFVSFKGFISDAEIDDFYETLDILIISTEGEGLPTTVIEAFNHGIPVIGSNVSGVNSIIQNGVNGLLFQYKDPIDLQTKIIELLKNSKLYQTISVNCRQSFNNNYTIQSVYNKYRQNFN